MTNGFPKKVRELDKKSSAAAGFNYSSLESVDNQIICLMRVLLAASALAITFIDPTSPDRWVEVTYAVLVGYCLYSAALYLLSRRAASLVPTDAMPWIDVAWYLILIALSNGTSSIFFFFFFFSILIAAFRSGFGAGLRVTIASALLFSIIGYATAPTGQEFELNRFLIRPVYLMMLGYMISYWGGQEIKHKRRLVLLKDVNRLSNPRFGVNRTLSAILNRLRAFYEAESCVLITFDSSTETYTWREATRDNPYEDLKTEQTKAAAPLINLPGELAIFHQNNAQSWYSGANSYACDVSTGGETEIAAETCAALADLLEAESFLTVPVVQGGEIIGRLYLTARQNCFERSEIEFISQLMEQIWTAVENVELLNHLASDAADRQRQKISRDLHDSTIQPYIGLKLGLEALELKCAAGESIEKDVEKLIRLTDSTIAELRGFVSSLKGEADEVEGNVLILAVKQQALKFKEFYDIDMRVEATDGFQLNDSLAAETFQILSEGLSNIKRHTKAKNGTIRIYRDGGKLFLEIENENREPSAAFAFVPKSIAGRAESLGGASRVERPAGLTKVLVEIPL
jgi:signal transduction histidine kinase